MNHMSKVFLAMPLIAVLLASTLSNVRSSTLPAVALSTATPGHLTRWISTTGQLGDSVVIQDQSGRIGIGTASPTSPLTVPGIIESTAGGFKFPDGSIQTAAQFGTITGVTAGTGLVGGGTSGNVTVGIANGGVATSQLADGSVTTGKIAPGAVTTTQIADASIAVTKLAPAPVNSRRAALNQWWTTVPSYDVGLGTTGVGCDPIMCASDGADIWVSNLGSATVSRVRASDGALLGTWSGPFGATAVLPVMGKVFVTGNPSPFASCPPPGAVKARIEPNITLLGSNLYMIDPAQSPPGSAVLVGHLPNGFQAQGLTFDGSRFWMTAPTGVAVISPGPNLPWSSQYVNDITGQGILFDGNNVWVVGDRPVGPGGLLKLNSDGSVALVIPGPTNCFPVFDGKNIWVPESPSQIIVVDASTGTVLKTLSGNGLNVPNQAAFDGQRVLVTNSGAETVSLWRAADFAPLGSFSTGLGSGPFGVCSDGVNFWITLSGKNMLARF